MEKRAYKHEKAPFNTCKNVSDPNGKQLLPIVRYRTFFLLVKCGRSWSSARTPEDYCNGRVNSIKANQVMVLSIKYSKWVKSWATYHYSRQNVEANKSKKSKKYQICININVDIKHSIHTFVKVRLGLKWTKH